MVLACATGSRSGDKIRIKNRSILDTGYGRCDDPKLCGISILIRVDKDGETRVYEISASSNAPIIPAANATAGSEYNGADIKAAANLINNNGMSGDSLLEDTHAVNTNATGMWHTANNPGDKAWVEIDLGKVYPLDEMWIWNLNQSGNAINIKRGLRNVKMEYSTDKSDWRALSPSNDLVFKEDTDPDYPFQLRQGTALDAMKATNLNDDQSSPVRFDGKEARYVRITAHPSKGIGTWGDSYFGLAELRFTSQLELNDLVPALTTPLLHAIIFPVSVITANFVGLPSSSVTDHFTS